MPARPVPGDAAWMRSRSIYRLLQIMGPLAPAQIWRILELNPKSIDSFLMTCDKCGFQLAEHGGRVSAWRVVGR